MAHAGQLLAIPFSENRLDIRGLKVITISASIPVKKCNPTRPNDMQQLSLRLEQVGKDTLELM
jgi:hypothetical protein